MKRRTILLLAALAMSTALVACGKETAEETQQEQEIVGEVDGTEIGDELFGETVDGKYRSELTNEWIDDSLKNQRPIAAMVDNESIALPHYGLSEADIVYEMMNSTENGRITRFMALFKDYESIDQIGSIRSVRPTNVILSAEWNAVLCHDGGPFYIEEYLAEPSTDHFQRNVFPCR